MYILVHLAASILVAAMSGALAYRGGMTASSMIEAAQFAVSCGVVYLIAMAIVVYATDRYRISEPEEPRISPIAAAAIPILGTVAVILVWSYVDPRVQKVGLLVSLVALCFALGTPLGLWLAGFRVIRKA